MNSIQELVQEVQRLMRSRRPSFSRLLAINYISTLLS